jgi:hypothetical protein
MTLQRATTAGFQRREKGGRAKMREGRRDGRRREGEGRSFFFAVVFLFYTFF